MDKQKHICFITPGHIASNPRLVKEAEAVSILGYKVSIIMSQYLEYLRIDDEKILTQHPDWKIFSVGWVGVTLKEKWNRFYSGLREVVVKGLVQKLNINSNVKETLISRVYYEQIHLAKKNKADIYIAHNLAALPVAAKAAKYHKTQYAFDAEDYHRGQLEIQEGFEYELIKRIEDKYLPQASYITGASPLISKKYETLYPQHKITTINNAFPSSFQKPFIKESFNETLSLFWFSQTVGANRGLEDVIAAMGLTQKKDILLTLLGSCSQKNKEYFYDLAKKAGLAINQIQFLDPVSPDKVFEVSSQHDIGLALEIPHSENRDICLTNKIFTYLIAGNSIIASETTAQKQFMQSYPKIGKTFPVGDVAKLAEILSFFYDERDELEKYKEATWNLGKEELNWEREGGKFLSKIKEVLS